MIVVGAADSVFVTCLVSCSVVVSVTVVPGAVETLVTVTSCVAVAYLVTVVPEVMISATAVC